MARLLARLLVAFSLVGGAVATFAADGSVSSLAEARTLLQQHPEKHILVFYKNYRS